LLKSQPPFDLLLDLRTFRDASDSAAASWIPAKVKIALDNAYPLTFSWVVVPGEERIYDVTLPRPSPAKNETALDIQNHRALLEYLFPNWPTARTALPKLAVSTFEREQLAKRFPVELQKPFLLVCPGTSSPVKEYPAKPLAAALLRVLHQHPMPVILAGSQSDTRTILPLMDELKDIPTLSNLCNQLNLAEHVALISMARAVVSMDSCHAHIAGALGVPAVAIIGGGHYGIFAPWGESPAFRWITQKLPCFNCHWKCIYDRPLCIHDIPVETISQALENVLALTA